MSERMNEYLNYLKCHGWDIMKCEICHGLDRFEYTGSRNVDFNEKQEYKKEIGKNVFIVLPDTASSVASKCTFNFYRLCCWFKSMKVRNKDFFLKGFSVKCLRHRNIYMSNTNTVSGLFNLNACFF